MCAKSLSRLKAYTDFSSVQSVKGGEESLLKRVVRKLLKRAPAHLSCAREDIVAAIAAELGVSPPTADQLTQLREEVRGNMDLRGQYDIAAPTLAEMRPNKPRLSWDERFTTRNGSFLANVDLFYVLLRVLKPEIVIETGVAMGSTSSLHLAAIHANRCGRLISVDLPPETGRGGMTYDIDPKARAILVPEKYKDGWEFITGDATTELPKLPRCDHFFHDSDHSYAHMVFEYAWATKAGAKVIVSDDVSQNEAFFRYFTEPMTHMRNPNIGAAVR